MNSVSSIKPPINPTCAVHYFYHSTCLTCRNGECSFVCVQTLLGCLGFGLTLMNTSSCSISDVMHCGSTSMSSLISNISTRGRQPCGEKERRAFKSFGQNWLVVSLAWVLNQHNFSSDPSPPSHVEKKNSGRSSMRQAFIYWAAFSSLDRANSSHVQKGRWCGERSAKNALKGSKPR